ncbi:zincin, partial [Fistulina hepatica ATCC 64428]
SFADTIGSTDGCPKTQDILYMGVAADCEYVQLAGGGASNATKQILTSWNTVSALYKSTFNISLGIVELELQDATCGSNTSSAWGVACSDNVTLNDRLSLFSKWRGERSGDDIGLWHLMSGCPTGTEIGIAWLSTLCQQISTRSSDSYVSGTAVSTAGTTEWQVVAHEIGHNFGAIHDCTSGCNSTSACCPLSTSACDADSKYIMNPATKSSENTFSQCSIGNICTMMRGTSGESLNTTCLVPASDAATNGRPLISLQMCGNGIVEDGEECDPGYNVTSACCDTSTCKFKDGATCDPLSSNGGCCTDSCGLRESGYVCRAAKDVACDFAETCTGNSSSCPADKYKTDGTSCGGNNLKCASGLCTSRSLQCQNLGASSGLEKACTKKDDTSCLVSCQDPSHANACISLNSQLIDGSPCGYGGACYSGVCKSAGALTTAKAWYTQNLKIAIPVTIIAAIVILCILWFLFVCKLKFFSRLVQAYLSFIGFTYVGIRRCCVRRRVRPLEPGSQRPFVPLPSTHFVGDSDSSGSLLVPKETRCV